MSSQHLQNLLYAFQRQQPASSQPPPQQTNGEAAQGNASAAAAPASLSNLSNLMQLIGRTAAPRPPQQNIQALTDPKSSSSPAGTVTPRQSANASELATSSHSSTGAPTTSGVGAQRPPSSTPLGLSSLLRGLSSGPQVNTTGPSSSSATSRDELPSTSSSHLAAPHQSTGPPPAMAAQQQQQQQQQLSSNSGAAPGGGGCSSGGHTSAMPPPPPQQHQQPVPSWAQDKSQQQQQQQHHQKPPPPPQMASSQHHPYLPYTAGQQQQHASSSHDTTQAAVLEPTVLALGLTECPFRPGTWRMDHGDIQRLIGHFGPCDCVKLLSSSCMGGPPDYALVYFSHPHVPETIQHQLDGTRLPGHGRLAISVFPASVLTGIVDEEGLVNYVMARLRSHQPATATTSATATPPEAQQPAGAPPMSMESVLDFLVDALTGGSGNALATALAAALGGNDAAYQNSSDSVRAVVHAVKNDPALLPALQVRLAALEGGGSKVSMPPVPPAPRALPKKRVCRLELVDLFTFHPELDIPALIVGADNSNIQYVLDEAKNKVDIELEGVPCNEAPVAERLHLTVIALDEEAYTTAVETLEDLLQSVCQQFAEFWSERKGGLPIPLSVGFRRHEYHEGDDGQLIYLGQSERPKPWLNTVMPQRYA